MPFQKCGSCRKTWASWVDFIRDPDVRLLGFQGSSQLPESNLLVFDHRCGTSISILATRLRHLLPLEEAEGQEFPLLFGSDGCSQHCRSIDDLKACDRNCVNARDRRLILAILEMKKN